MTIIDVRQPFEFQNDHADGAINIPLDSLQTSSALLNVNKKEEVIVYCNSGNRSGAAKRILVSMGYKNVINGINKETVRTL